MSILQIFLKLDDLCKQLESICNDPQLNPLIAQLVKTKSDFATEAIRLTFEIEELRKFDSRIVNKKSPSLKKNKHFIFPINQVSNNETIS